MGAYHIWNDPEMGQYLPDEAKEGVAVKCGGKIVSESTYRKRGTDVIMKDYKYEILLKEF